jgi:hypothetical protein
MKPHSAIKADLFANEHHRQKIDALGDPLSEIDSHIDLRALRKTRPSGKITPF